MTGETPWFFPYEGKSEEEIGQTLRVKRQLVRLNFEKADKEMPEDVKDILISILNAPSEDSRKGLATLKAVVNGQPIPKEDVITRLRQEPTEQKKEEEDMTVSVQAEVRQGNGFKDVAGMEELKDIVRKKIIFVLKNRELAERYKLTPPNGMLLYGPPGCGKTFFAEKFAEESGFRFIDVKASDVGSPYIHGTQGKVADLFKKAEAQPPTVICFDEFDAFVPNRSGVDNQSLSSEVNEFLSQLNNCAKRGIFIVCTSNRPDKIDPAVLRTGRIDQLIYVPAPDQAARRRKDRTLCCQRHRIYRKRCSHHSRTLRLSHNAGDTGTLHIMHEALRERRGHQELRASAREDGRHQEHRPPAYRFYIRFPPLNFKH